MNWVVLFCVLVGIFAVSMGATVLSIVAPRWRRLDLAYREINRLRADNQRLYHEVQHLHAQLAEGSPHRKGQ